MLDAEKCAPRNRSTAAGWAQRRGPFTYADALAAGATGGRVRQLVATGTWVSLRKSVLCDAEVARCADDGWLRASAALHVMAPDTVVSHETAAHLHDLPTTPSRSDVVWLTRPATSRNGRHEQPGIIERAAVLPANHVTGVLTLPVTTVARTVVDLARHLSFVDAVVLADAALHRDLVTMHELDEVRRFCASWPGIVRAEHVLAFTDGDAESPLESISRVGFADRNLPPPELQTKFHLRDGTLTRSDFYWPEWGVIGEADGRLKYTDEGALWREKQREDALRDLGYEVVRWTWDEIVHTPDVVVARIMRAVARRAARS